MDAKGSFAVEREIVLIGDAIELSSKPQRWNSATLIMPTELPELVEVLRWVPPVTQTYLSTEASRKAKEGYNWHLHAKSHVRIDLVSGDVSVAVRLPNGWANLSTV